MGKVQFLAEQKSGSAAGTNTRLLPTAVSAATLHPPGKRSNGALRSATVATATATVAARNVKGNDPLPARVTLRYTRYASTQGERGWEDATPTPTATATATVAARATASATATTGHDPTPSPCSQHPFRKPSITQAN
jgi:hypothetical protein